MENRGGRLITRLSSDEASFNYKFFKRFWKICGLLFPSIRSPSACLTFLLLLLCILEQVIINYIGLVPSKFYKIFTDDDRSSFVSHVLYSVGLILAEAFVLSTKLYVASVLYITWRSNISTALHDLYFSDILYYKLNVVDKSIDNPDQRITQDVDQMCNTFSKVLVPIIITPFTTGYYMYYSWQVTQYIGPVSTVVFFIIFTVINKLLMSPVVRYFYLQQKREGDFRFHHMQIRTNSESAAFYRAGNLEKSKANMKLQSLLSTQNKLIRWEYVLNCSINTADYLGGILSYIAIAFSIFGGQYKDLSPGDLTALISQNGFYSIYLINCFTKLIDQSVQVTDVAGAAHRISQLFEELGRLKADTKDENNYYIPAVERPLQSSGSTAFKVQDVTYGLPKSSKVLCKNLTFQLSAGTSVLVTGDSGCGKTSLLRVLSGLWKSSSGDIDKNVNLGPTGLLYLPQKPYLTDGTLREQVIYPLQESETLPDDTKILYYLDLVGLKGLVERLGGLSINADWNWYDEMSPGEMQRLSFVRLFFHKPPYAILDEATSQVSQEMESLLYSTCRKLGITYMSIGHRSTIRPYHEMELHLTGDGGWALSSIGSNINSDYN
ncbi:lysosomal cobalamin transporter ABCD4-like isoform X2 [Physella acuta]|uniref:lysosomal cobalamin transporter ABCD4-like isoform X2 n=1 Tax=Physella acuta TaxID=109671 RepID=UPI0027DBCC0F|nr:lysosomal cobalamin transporter ABCD4-like isoform X2 [Physella acuta]